MSPVEITAGVQPAAVAVRPPPQPHRRAERAHHLRRDGRPVAQEAHAGGLRPRQPRPAAARLRARRLRPPRLGRPGLREGRARRGQAVRAHPVRRGRLEAAGAGHPLRVRASSTTTRPSSSSRRPLDELDRERGTMGNHAFYLSIPPKSFPLVTEQLRRSGLAEQQRRASGAASSSRSRSAAT